MSEFVKPPLPRPAARGAKEDYFSAAQLQARDAELLIAVAVWIERGAIKRDPADIDGPGYDYMTRAEMAMALRRAAEQ